MPHLVWSRRANADLDRLYAFIAMKNRTAALHAILHVRDEVSKLVILPYLGKALDGGSPRELIIPFGKAAYRVLYTVTPRRVEILAIRHSRELYHASEE